jgi:hypothetical protein
LQSLPVGLGHSQKREVSLFQSSVPVAPIAAAQVSKRFSGRWVRLARAAGRAAWRRRRPKHLNWIRAAICRPSDSGRGERGLSVDHGPRIGVAAAEGRALPDNDLPFYTVYLRD